MLSPPIPANEAERLAELERLEVLDSEPELVFDRLTTLASRLFGVPIALVSLVSADRQWFKSKVGLDVAETSREVSFCGHALERAGPLVVPDALADTRFEDNPLVSGAPSLRFYAGAPLRTQGGLSLGTLCVIDRVPRKLSAAELCTLEDLAAIAVEALEARLIARRHRAAAERLRSVVEAVEEGVIVCDAQGRFEVANAAAAAIVGELPVGSARPKEQIEGYGLFEADGVTPLRVADGPTARALAGAVVAPVEVLARTPRQPHGQLLRLAARPLVDPEGRPAGAVTTFTDVTELRAAEERLVELANTDPLTGLANKRAFYERLEDWIAHGHRGRAFALVMLDLDHFKAVNDTHGHAIGDLLLMEVAATLRRRLRRNDVAARYGGEEFCVVLGDVGPEQAAVLAEELRARVAAITEPVSVTASFGLCSFDVRRATATSLLAAADAALYEAKRLGRNRVVVGSGAAPR